MARWAYRVVFWPTASEPGADRPGTIARANQEDADTEARAIAQDGGTAEVRFVAEDGSHQVIATYRPTPAEPRHAITPDTRFPSARTMAVVGLAVVLALTVLRIVLVRRRGGRATR